MVFKSLSSLSENRRSWSADVPLKNPESGEQKLRRERAKRIPWHVSSQLTSVGHLYGFNSDAVAEGSVVGGGGGDESAKRAT